MTPAQIDLVQASWTKVLPIKDKVATLFYEKLFALNPELKSLFTGDMKEQGRKLISIMGVVVSSIGRLESITPNLQTLSRKHLHYGVKERDYDTVGNALIWTLEQGLAEAFTVDVRNAWIKTYVLISDVMKDAVADEVTYGFTD